MIQTEIAYFHLFAGAGSGAAGMQEARPEIPGMVGRMVCLGGIDVDPAGAADFQRFTGVRCTVRDLFSRDQYTDFHGAAPPPGWIEATPADLRAAAGGRRPNIVFLSAPCKGFSGLLSQSRSLTAKYQAINALTLRGVWLMLEAWKDDPPEVILFENVPRIATRGRHFLDQIVQLLHACGYVVRETAHDCGVLGGLAQSRKRFLLIARHAEKVPAFVYEPPKRPLRAVGEILGCMHLPGDLRAGPMHRIPNLSWKTWVRLAFVEAGSDWRSLNRLAVEGGNLRDYLIVPEMYRGGLGVRRWDESTGAVAGESLPLNGAFSVADPRAAEGAGQYGQFGVMHIEGTAGTVIGVKSPGQGTFCVADPRGFGADTHKNVFRVVPWDNAAGTVSSGHGPSSGGQCVADPRHDGPAKHSNEFRIVRQDEAARAVTSAHGTGLCVADSRTGWPEGVHGNKLVITPFDDVAKTVTGARFGSGGLCVADPRGGPDPSRLHGK